MKVIMKTINMIAFPLTLFSGLLLLLASAAPFVSPETISWLQFFGLAFPVLLLLNLLWLFFWWVQLKMKMLAPLCFLVLSLYNTSKYVQYTAVRPKPEKPLTVASYNTQLFGVYQGKWFIDTVVDEIRTRNFDVVCLQEVFANKGKSIESYISSLRKNANFKMYSFYRLVPERNYGMVILSKYKIVHSGRIDFPGSTGNMAMYADIIYDLDTIRVYNVHLQSIRFRKTDYRFVQGNDDESQSKIEKSKGVVRLMKEAYLKRARQAEVVAAHIKQCPYDMLVCGDFNDVPLSYTYQTMSRGLYDAFREAGRAVERTYKGPFPSFRIDYILHSRNFYCSKYFSSSSVPGDHKLIWAEYDMAKKL